MSVRAAQAKALQQLQALSLRQWSATQTIRAKHFISFAATSTNTLPRGISGQQAHMTIGQPFSCRLQIVQNTGSINQQQQQQVHERDRQKNKRPGAGFTTPSPSSSMSDYCHLDRQQLTAASASTKSAKRKAAEALLAARYSNSITAAAATFSAAPAAAQLQCKRHRSSLASVINKFTEDTASAGNKQDNVDSGHARNASAAAAAAAAAARAGAQHKPQLAKLQQVLERLHGQHKQLIQQPHHHQQMLQQQQQPQQQQCSDGSHEEDQRVAVAAGGAAGLQEQHAAAGQQQHQQQYVQVPACDSSCTHTLSQGWCHTQVRLPHVEWGRVLEADLSKAPSFKVAQGYERMVLPGGVQVLVVENPAYLQNALQQLRASMGDPIVAIDLEWRPSFGRRFTPVAMIQLASSKIAVLVRTCRMNHRLPAALKDFLKDPSITLVGFGWGSSDEPKMQSTFGLGCRDFGRFVDLQAVAQGLGYCKFGLARLTTHVLGLHLPKSKRVSMSDWETVALSRTQVKYAALDVLVAGQVFRALRLWHSSPSLCEVCHYDLGSTSTSSVYSCTCGKAFTDIRGYLSHCTIANHKPKWAECSGCGCTRQLPWPSGGGTELDHAEQGGGSDSSISSDRENVEREGSESKD